jgi:hypothetical protein
MINLRAVSLDKIGWPLFSILVVVLAAVILYALNKPLRDGVADLRRESQAWKDMFRDSTGPTGSTVVSQGKDAPTKLNATMIFRTPKLIEVDDAKYQNLHTFLFDELKVGGFTRFESSAVLDTDRTSTLPTYVYLVALDEPVAKIVQNGQTIEVDRALKIREKIESLFGKPALTVLIPHPNPLSSAMAPQLPTGALLDTQSAVLAQGQ